MNLSLGEQIRSLRESAGVMQKDLARAARITPSHLSYIENDDREPSLDVLRRIARLLNRDLHVALRKRA